MVVGVHCFSGVAVVSSQGKMYLLLAFQKVKAVLSVEPEYTSCVILGNVVDTSFSNST